MKEFASRSDLIKDKVNEEKIVNTKPFRGITDTIYVNKDPTTDGKVDRIPIPQKTSMEMIRASKEVATTNKDDNLRRIQYELDAKDKAQGKSPPSSKPTIVTESKLNLSLTNPIKTTEYLVLDNATKEEEQAEKENPLYQDFFNKKK